jgi:DMSO/TMAO reductase YedYZ heme-binding membrane subunit
MPIVVTLALLVLWLVLAWREYQKGDFLLATIFAAVGVVLALYRYRAAMKRTQQTKQPNPQDPLK